MFGALQAAHEPVAYSFLPPPAQPLKKMRPFLASLHKNKQGGSSKAPVKGIPLPKHSGHIRRSPTPLVKRARWRGPHTAEPRARLRGAWGSGFQRQPQPSPTMIHHHMSSSDWLPG